MRMAGVFAANGNQTEENLVHFQIVGEWRDSTNGTESPPARQFETSIALLDVFKSLLIVFSGLVGGKITYDVNTAPVPAALRSLPP